MPTPQLGVLSKLYFDDTGYQEIDLIDDLSVNGSWNSTPANARRSIVDAEEPTTMALELAGKVRFDPADPGYSALRDAWISRSKIKLLAMTGPLDVNGEEGIEFFGKVHQWNDDQSRGAVGYRDFTIKPCVTSEGEEVPRHVTVVGGALTYDEFGAETS